MKLLIDMNGLTDFVDERTLNGFSCDEWSMPKHDIRVLERCRGLCRENKCGHYGTNWGCPPGFDLDLEAFLEKYSRAFMLKRRFTVDVTDADSVRSIAREVQETIRNVMTEIRSKGVECQGFADGGCTYCGECSYPEPCRFPSALVPSISSIGLDMEGYAKDNGEEFAFEKDAVTMYGLLLL